MNPRLPLSALTDELSGAGVIKPQHKSHLEKLFEQKGKLTISELQEMTDADWAAVNLPQGLIQVIRSTVGPRTPPHLADRPSSSLPALLLLST